MATLKMGSTTMLTESSGALTVNASNPTVTLGSNATFPAGHVIQTTAVTTATTYGNVGNGTFVDTVITGSITPLYADSSILMIANFNCYVHDTASDFGFSFRVKKVHSGGTSYPDSMNQYSGSGNMHGTVYHNWGNGDGSFNIHPTLLDPSAGVAGSAITYTLQGDSYNVSNTITMGGNVGNRWSLYFQEIKR
jgi:hypothetical protein